MYPFAGLAREVRLGVPRLLFNRELSSSFHEDNKNDLIFLGKISEKFVLFIPGFWAIAYLGDIVENLRNLCNELGWLNELENLIASNEKQ